MDADAKLAEMEARIVASRQLDLRQSIALRLFKANGSVTAAEVDADYAEEWVDVDAQLLADLVAKKVASSVDYHKNEAALAVEHAASIAAKAEKFAQLAAEAAEAAEARSAESTSAAEAAEAAEALLEHAIARGGDPGRAPSGQDAAANALVADAVGEAGTPGGN